jgi:6,7-dimethyl-8-ribityllumazine synthase
VKDVAEKTPAPKLPGAKILLVVSPYYRSVADMMQRGAEAAAEQAEVTLDRIFVPGAFEIPAAIAHASKANIYDGFVALGVSCAVRPVTMTMSAARARAD